MSERMIAKVFRGTETRDGAGVRLIRVFSNREAALLDPFLLFDAFGSEDSADYLPGFPWHPHRGIETVTYMREGRVRHGDSLGNSGTIGPGDLQWMSAGSGIIHEEMPQLSPRGVSGFQLWVNLPAAEKMRAPEYRDAPASAVPAVPVEGGEVRPFAGSFAGTPGPLVGIARDPAYFDVSLKAGATLSLPTPTEHTAFAYVYAGELGTAGGAVSYAGGTCLLFGPGEAAVLSAGPDGASFVFAHAQPLRESIAWGGPIVMNTREELETAFRELDEGTFIKSRGKKNT